MATRHDFSIENGTKFHIRRYDVFTSMKILGDVQKKFLAPFALFMEANDKSMSQEIRDKNMVDAVEKFSKSLDGDSLIEITKKVLDPEYISVSINGEPPQKLEPHVLNLSVDSISDVIALVIEVMKVNYEDLFMKGKTLIGKVQSPGASH